MSVPYGRVVVVGVCVVVALAVPGRAQTATSVWDGVYTEEQSARGNDLYRDGCAECHGEGLEGGEMEPALTGGEFMYNWNGLSVGDLLERLRVSMPYGAPRTMSLQEKADVLAYMLAENGVPAGTVELASSVAALRSISFDAVKP